MSNYTVISFNGGWSIRAGDRELCTLQITDGWQPAQIQVLTDLLNDAVDSKASRAIAAMVERERPRTTPTFGAKQQVSSTRPKEHETEIRIAAVKTLLPEIQRWLGDEYEEDEVILDLLSACQAHRDGYEITKYLDNHRHWTCDGELVEILDGFGSALSEAHQHAVEAWLPESGLKPAFSEGQEVQFEGRQAFIARVDLKQGRYTVRVPALGHVESGVGTHGNIVDWEVLDAAQLVKA